MLLVLILAFVGNLQATNIQLGCYKGVENLQLKENENGLLYATWSPIENFSICYKTYKLEVYLNNILVKTSFTTLASFELLDMPVEPCTVVKVQLTAINDFYSSDIAEERFVPVIGPVGKITFENNIVSWEKPNNFVHCTYEVIINDKKDWVNQEEDSYDVNGLNLEHCRSHRFSVTPIGYDLTKGKSSEISFETDLEISNVYIQEEKFGAGAHAVWTDLGKSCKYSVKVNTHLEHDRIAEHSVILKELNAYDCRTYTIEVQAHGATRSGSWKEFSYEQEPFFNFEGISGVMAVASRFLVSMYWELDSKLKYCDISYNIMCSINNGNKRMDFDVVDVSPYLLEKCKVDSFTNTLEVYIQPVYHATVGNILFCQFGIDYANGATFHNGCEYL